MTFHIAAHRSRGTSHRKVHTPCQDACGVSKVLPVATDKPTEDLRELVVGAVADGGGSRPFSHIGARMTVSLAISSMRSTWTAESMQLASPGDLEFYWRSLCEDCRRVLQIEAESRGFVDGNGAVDSGPLACTLVVFMATHDRLSAAQVGDGFLTVGRAVSDSAAGSVDYSLVFQNRESEYAGQVVWLTAPGWENDLRTRVLDGPVSLVVASSDGMEKAVLQASPERPGELAPHGRYFDQLAGGCRQVVEEARASQTASQKALENYLSAVLSSPRLDDRTDDDKSMALAVWLESGE